jgi:hypothetical protein
MEKKSVGLLELETAVLECFLEKTPLSPLGVNFHRFGPFSVVKQINVVAFFLELSPSMKIHPIFHVSLLKLYKESSIPGRFQVPLHPLEIEGQEELEVSKILDLESIKENWNILFNGRNMTLVKRPGNLSPIFVII